MYGTVTVVTPLFPTDTLGHSTTASEKDGVMSLNISNFESAELDRKSSIVLVTDVNVLLHSNNQHGVENWLLISVCCVKTASTFDLDLTQWFSSSHFRLLIPPVQKSKLKFLSCLIFTQSISFSTILNNSRFCVKNNLSCILRLQHYSKVKLEKALWRICPVSCE